MIIIEDAKEYVSKLWGKQKICFSEVYRLMKYIVCVDHDNKVLLHNVVTGQLICLEENERLGLKGLPERYDDWMKKLVENHFLVPVDYDEHKQVRNIRLALRTMKKRYRPNEIVKYTILPTTSCNARCYYCVEQGVSFKTMTKEQADEVLRYMVAHSSKKISIHWYGGEPTVASKRISQICSGLKQEGIEYDSWMISNGYLFDEKLVKEAKEVWNLKHIRISVDGIEENYNKIKNFVSVSDNPYRRMLNNIGLLLEAKIAVTVRMNFDVKNYTDFELLLLELKERFQENGLLHVYAYPIVGEYKDMDGEIHHGDDEWFKQKMIELNSIATEEGMYAGDKDIPSLRYYSCAAENDDYTIIGPTGLLARCMNYFEEHDAIGCVLDGITDEEKYKSWKEISDPELCINCTFYPACVKLKNCPSCGLCLAHSRNNQYIRNIKSCYDKFINQN